MNARLPGDVRVLRAEEARDGFHARSSARAKEYRYRIDGAEVTSPFIGPFVWSVRGALDIEALGRAAAALVGRHDFTSFCRADCELDDRVRTLRRSEIRREDGEIVYVVEGDGFLRHMVRTIVGTLVEVGRGRRAPEAMGDVLRARDRRAAGVCAPASGLALARVEYGEEER